LQTLLELQENVRRSRSTNMAGVRLRISMAVCHVVNWRVRRVIAVQGDVVRVCENGNGREN